MSTPNIKFGQLRDITEKNYQNFGCFEERSEQAQQNEYLSISQIDEQMLINELCHLLDEQQIKNNLNSELIERIQRLFSIIGKNEQNEEQEQLFRCKEQPFEKKDLLFDNARTPMVKQKKNNGIKSGNINRFPDKPAEKNVKKQKKRQISENSLKSKQRQSKSRQKPKLKFFVEATKIQDRTQAKRSPLRPIELNSNSASKQKQRIQKSSSKKLLLKNSISNKNLSNNHNNNQQKVKAQIISPSFSNKKINVQTRLKTQSRQKRTINNSSSLKKMQSTTKIKQKCKVFQLKNELNQKAFETKFNCKNLYTKSNSSLSTAQLTKFNTLSDECVVKKANQLIRRVYTQEQTYKQAIMIQNLDEDTLFGGDQQEKNWGKKYLQEDKACQEQASLELMKTISSIQSNSENEQCQLENRINNYKLLISVQRAKIEQHKNSSSSIKKQIIDLQEQISSIKRKKEQIHKKLQQIWQEVKSLNSGISDCKNQNQSVLTNLKQEKELVKMYGKVIEQMKAQLRVQIEARDQLKNLVKHSKKQHQAVKLRALNTKDRADFMKNQVKESINKWTF